VTTPYVSISYASVLSSTLLPIMEKEMEKVGKVRYVLDNKYGEGFVCAMVKYFREYGDVGDVPASH